MYYAGMKLKRKDINKFVKPFAAHKWHELGLELEVGDEKGLALDDIKDKYEGNEECFDHMIHLWFKEADATQLTVGVLLDCLMSLKLNDAVQSLQSNTVGGTWCKHSDLARSMYRDN